ncbi:MAG: hypothetical protein ACE5ID_00445 [Acidobacteriota bacterium]
MKGPESLGQEAVERLKPAGGTTLEIKGTHGRLHLEVDDADRLGVMVRSIHLDSVALSLSARQLKSRLEDLALRVDYLPERLSIVEHDPDRTGAILRSSPPHRSGAARDYFELRVSRRLGLHFQRYRQPPGAGPRRPLPSLLDRRTLARLIDDMAAVTGT